MNWKYFVFTILISLPYFSFSQKDSIYFEIATEFNSEGNFKKGLSFLNKAIKLNPSNHYYLDEKAWLLKHLNKDYDAIVCLNEGVNKNPENPHFLYIRAIHHLNSMGFEVAITDFDEALNFVPTGDSLEIKILRNRGLAKSYLNDSIGAFIDLQNALKIDTNNVLTLSDLSITYMAFKNHKKAIECLSKASEIDKFNTFVLSNLGYLYTLTEQYKQAIGILNKAISLFPDESGNYNNRGYAFLKLGKIDAAEKDITLAITLDPENAYAYKNKALMHIEKAEISKACYNLQVSHELGYTKQYNNQVIDLMEKHCK